MKHLKKIAMLSVASVMLLANNGGCQSSDPAAEHQMQETAAMDKRADMKVGMPAIDQFSERQQLKDIYERRDHVTSSYAYFQSYDGHLLCLGRAFGYGLPYGAQFTAPEAPKYFPFMNSPGPAVTEMMAQSEPNGLYMPSTAEATWIEIVDPKTGKLDVVESEPHLVISPFELTAPLVSVPCTGADPSTAQKAF